VGIAQKFQHEHIDSDKQHSEQAKVAIIHFVDRSELGSLLDGGAKSSSDPSRRQPGPCPHICFSCTGLELRHVGRP
jgi:hypothetical protein